jgi:hypothetical protein
MNIVQQEYALADLVRQAIQETNSRQAHRLAEYLLVHDVGLTTDICRACALTNISCAASYIKPALQRRGYTIVATLPRDKIPNRFGEPSQVHEWRLVRLR